MSFNKFKQVLSTPLEDNENKKKLQVEGSTSCAGVRSSLGNIENILSQKKSVNVRTARRSVSTLETITTKNKKIRSSSANEVEANAKYFFKSCSITKDDEITEHLDEVFVEGDKHYINPLPKSSSTDCISTKLKLKDEEEEGRITKPSVPAIRVSKTKKEGPKPAQKVNLVRNIYRRRERFSLEEAFPNCLYDEIYFEDSYHYMIETEKKFINQKSALKISIDENLRMIVINWLIYLQQELNLGENTFFMAVRIFDYILVTCKIPANEYLLIGVASMWITNKLVDVHFIQATKLFALCKRKFSREQIISAEKKILRALNFQTNIPEPSLFLFYYLKRECLHNTPEVVYSAMFLLECFTLLLDFSSLAPSVLASLALFIALDTSKGSYFLEHFHLLQKETFIREANVMKASVQELLKHECVSKTVKAKYRTEEKYFVVRNFETKCYVSNCRCHYL